ncbi:MAG: tetratricopeptide repeat protein [Polyangiaceae bacterium]|nr:tetratricopeptide repeat protein [Polyangiaceae bacterium]
MRAATVLSFVIATASSLGVPSAAAALPGDAETRALTRATEARARGDLDGAIATLKKAWDDLPHSEAVVLALAQAYLADDNPTWAARVLSEHLDYHEDACNARFLLAWIHVKGGMTNLAHELLDGKACDAPPEIRARGELLRAHLAHVEDRDAEARGQLGKVRRSSRIYEEDRVFLKELTREVDPPRTHPVASAHAEFGFGWTSNGLAGSPVDIADPETADSALTLVNLGIRLTAPSPAVAQPVLEGQLRAQQLWANDARDLSFGTGALRAGVLLGQDTQQALVAFSTEATSLAGGDRYDEGPLWFSEAQRGEIELGVGNAFVLFAGGGRRRFRDIGRTRTEGDLAVGWLATGPQGLLAIGGSSIRGHDGENDAYDLLGASAVTQAFLPVWRGVELSAMIASNIDVYPRSEGYFAGSAGSARRDLQLRLGGGAWSPRRYPLRVGLTFESASRASSAEAYDYVDNRWLVRLEWRTNSHTLGRRAIGRTGRTPFDYGTFAAGSNAELGEVRELMRQDDAAQRGASCLR